MFWQELLSMLHKSLGPAIFSAMPAHIPHWCEFWPWQADLASWLDFRPALSLQTSLPILALGWRQLLSLDVLCSHCWDAQGLCWWELCPVCFAAVSAPAHLSLHSSVRRDLFVCMISCLCPARTPRSSNSHFTASNDMTEQTGWDPKASLCRVQMWQPVPLRWTL